MMQDKANNEYTFSATAEASTHITSTVFEATFKQLSSKTLTAWASPLKLIEKQSKNTWRTEMGSRPRIVEGAPPSEVMT
jgi:uncharacterized protein YkwD